MKYHPLLIAALLGLAACGERSTQDKLIGNWQETSVDNPQMDQMITDQQIFIDTIGRSTTPAQNLELYGVSDIDSLKERLLADLNTAREQRSEAVRSTRFEFLKGKTMVIHAGSAADSCRWEIEEDGALVLDQPAQEGQPGMHLRFEVLALNDTMLKLRYNEKYLTSTTVFRRLEK